MSADRSEYFGTFEHCGPRGACTLPKGHDGACDPLPPLPPASGMPRPPAEEPRSRPETPEGSTDRGTGVGGPHARSEAVPNTASERIEQIRTGLADLDEVDHGMTGVKGRYGWRFNSASQTANLYQDLRWLLDHVDRLNTVLADEVPDVDGWTLNAHPTGFMLSHETDEDRVLTAHRLPVGAVLAFIADQEGQADER